MQSALLDPAVPAGRSPQGSLRTAGRVVLALCLALAALAGVLGAAPAAASAATVNPGMEWQFLSMLNAYRAQNHRPAVAMSVVLTGGIARPWAAHMAATGSLVHNPNVGVQIPRAVPAWRSLGENIGVGYSVSSLNSAFIASTPHRENMLNGSYNYVGIGVYTVGTQIWVTVDFVGTPSTLARMYPAPVPVFRAMPAVTTDFTGAGRADASVFRPSSGTWYMHNRGEVAYGQAGDVPVPGHYTGGAVSQPAVFRPSTGVWYRWGLPAVHFGQAGDIPTPADFNGDGRTDIAVFRPSTGVWYRWGMAPLRFGQAGDIPVAGSYRGGRTDLVAVFRPSTGQWFRLGLPTVTYGMRGDVPVPGQYSGGATQPAVYRPSTGTWYRIGMPGMRYGNPGDVPVPARFLGGATTHLAVWRPSNGVWYVLGGSASAYGVRGDHPLH